jgi:hypothetical protein
MAVAGRSRMGSRKGRRGGQLLDLLVVHGHICFVCVALRFLRRRKRNESSGSSTSRTTVLVFYSILFYRSTIPV